MSITHPSSGLPRLALIAGPTASGKSARALDLAEREGGTIINADASQVYRDLRVLSARPSVADEARVPHRLFGHRDGALACSAADWAEDAKAAIAETHAAGRLPILVGGTGLYMRTLLDGIAPVPEIEAAVRAAVRALPAAEARAALEREDPAAANRLHPHDSGRSMRALEVIRSTGRPIAAWRADRIGGIRRSVALEVTLIDPPVDELYARCDARVEQMIADGAVEEVAALLARKLDPALPILRAIGVPQLAAYLRGDSSLDEAIAAIRLATRHYAKRQRTWFRNQPLDGDGPTIGA
jgi:tRNA dimethylallyltransferase